MTEPTRGKRLEILLVKVRELAAAPSSDLPPRLHEVIAAADALPGRHRSEAEIQPWPGEVNDVA